MLKFVNLFILIICLSPCLLFSETHLGGELEGDQHWDIDGSPYIVEDLIFLSDSAELRIDPGVVVDFTNYHGIMGRNNNIIAEGTPDDSIYFIADEIWGCIFIGGREAAGSFDYCNFYNSFGFDESMSALDQFYSLLSVKHTTFRRCWSCINTCGVTVIEDCLFENARGGVLTQLDGDSTIIRRSVFRDVSSYNFVTYNGIADHCLFFDGFTFGDRNSSIINSIFVRTENFGTGCAIWHETANIRNNCFYRYGSLTQNDVEYVGIIDCVNANGDSTDRFGNMLLDPQLVGLIDSVYLYPDSYCLTDDSPCIDAGDPESDPDPDGTRSDIGAFFFPQQNIAVDPDTLEFTGIQTGIMDSIAVTIHNIGLDTLEIDSLFITQEGDVFNLNLDGEFFLEPDSSSVVWVMFSPVVQAQYEAVLTITSNDRDQSSFKIPIIASALSVEDKSIDTPEDFEPFEAYPNPFNSTTSICYQLSEDIDVTLKIFDISGREVVTLVNGKLNAGYHTITWEANVPSGLYVCRMEAGSYSKSIKLVLNR